MIENVYCIYDKQTNMALKPFFIHRNDVAPVRELEDIVSNKDSIIHKHAGDFDLIHIGTVNLETMELDKQPPRLVVHCLDLLDDKT